MNTNSERKDIVGKVVKISKKRSFMHQPAWATEPQERSIINLYVEAQEPKYGIMVIKEEQIVLFGKIADEADQILRTNPEAYILSEGCEKSYDYRNKKYYRSWAASNLVYLKPEEFETVKHNMIKAA